MRILITGSRDFHAHYRVERAIKNALEQYNDEDSAIRICTVLTVDGRRRTRGAERVGRSVAEDFGYYREEYASVAEANPDVCLVFMVPGDEDMRPRRIAMQAEKAGIPTWRYFQ